MSLPLPAVDRIFARLMAAYGRQFADLYADLDPADVKTAWCHELAVFGSGAGLRRIAWALDNLPDRAPNAPQFRNLCRQAPADSAPALPLPSANPERMREELAKLGHLDRSQRMATPSAINHRAWARTALARHAEGQPVRPVVLRFACEALGLPEPKRVRR